MSDSPQLKQLFKDFINDINNDLKDVSPLKNISQKINIQPAYFVLIVIGFVILMTLTGLLGHIFITLFGTLYPAYMSFKSIKQNKQNERKRWMTYWIVFGFFTAFDKLIGLVLFFLPAYYTMKVLFYIWMFYPKTKGAALIYDKFLRDQLIKFKEYNKKYQN